MSDTIILFKFRCTPAFFFMTVLYIFYCYVKLYILISLQVNLRIMGDSGSVMEKQKAIA